MPSHFTCDNCRRQCPGINTMADINGRVGVLVEPKNENWFLRKEEGKTIVLCSLDCLNLYTKEEHEEFTIASENKEVSKSFKITKNQIIELIDKLCKNRGIIEILLDADNIINYYYQKLISSDQVKIRNHIKSVVLDQKTQLTEKFEVN